MAVLLDCTMLSILPLGVFSSVSTINAIKPLLFWPYLIFMHNISVIFLEEIFLVSFRISKEVSIFFTDKR